MMMEMMKCRPWRLELASSLLSRRGERSFRRHLHLPVAGIGDTPSRTTFPKSTRRTCRRE